MVRLPLRVRKWQQALRRRLHPTPVTTPLQRPTLDLLAQPDYPLPSFVQACPVAQKYLTLLGPLDWSHFPERDERARPWPGPIPQPRAPFAAAFLVQIAEQKRYHSDLRTFLVEHPALVWLLGFPLVPDEQAPHGFDVAASVPTRRRFGAVLRGLAQPALQFLLDSTVMLIQQALPPEEAATFGQTVSGDTKHIIAWVKENNPKAFIKEGRYDKSRQPHGDRDCKLGVKKKRNTSPSAPAAVDPPTPARDGLPAASRQGGDELYWGYASGVIATKVGEWAEVVLAERTDTFDRADVSYFQPLMADTTRRLGFHPPFGAFDAAFDAWYVHQPFYEAGGFAAVPYVAKGNQPRRQFDDAGLPLCAAGLGMPLTMRYLDRTTSLVEQPKGKFACPLLVPQPTATRCPIDHPKWASGGCTTTMGTSAGARLRHTLDRQSPAYKEVYRQRTADERVNSQAVEWGIERPRLRNYHSISNRNTLIYVLINLRALQRIRTRRAQLPAELPRAS